jgi:hypothetical protein
MTTSKSSKDAGSPLATRLGKFGSPNKVAISEKIFKIKLCSVGREVK